MNQFDGGATNLDRNMLRDCVESIRVMVTPKILNVHAAVHNLFNLGRHLVSAKTYRDFRLRSFASWINAVMI